MLRTQYWMACPFMCGAKIVHIQHTHAFELMDKGRRELTEWTLNMKPLDMKKKIIILHWNMNLCYIFAWKLKLMKAIYIWNPCRASLAWSQAHTQTCRTIDNIQKPIVGYHCPVAQNIVYFDWRLLLNFVVGILASIVLVSINVIVLCF